MKKITLLSILLCFWSFSGLVYGKDLNASLAYLPTLAESPDKGSFVDLVKAIDEVYTDGEIKISVYPFARSVHNVVTGKSDFHIPFIINKDADQTNLPYEIVSEKMGIVNFVIYSHPSNPITKKMLQQAIEDYQNEKSFPYTILIGRGLESQSPFPVIFTNSLEQSLIRVSKNRADALIWAQEEADFLIKKLKLKEIYREHWKNIDDVIIIPKNENSKELNKILAESLCKLKKSGKLETIYQKIHKPYNNWQPQKMDW